MDLLEIHPERHRAQLGLQEPFESDDWLLFCMHRIIIIHNNTYIFLNLN